MPLYLPLWQNLTQEEPAGCGERVLPPYRHRRGDGVPPLRPEGVIAVYPGEDAQEGEMAPPDDGVAQQVDAVVFAGAEPLTSARIKGALFSFPASLI